MKFHPDSQQSDRTVRARRVDDELTDVGLLSTGGAASSSMSSSSTSTG